MRQIVEQHSEILQLVHRHYPLDDSCHPQLKRPFHKYACAFARAAYCAGQQGYFWEMNDWLYSYRNKMRPSELSKTAKRLGLESGPFLSCLKSKAAEDAIARDLGDGMGLKLKGTPAFVIDGKIYMGTIPPKILRAAIKAGPDTH